MTNHLVANAVRPPRASRRVVVVVVAAWALVVAACAGSPRPTPDHSPAAGTGAAPGAPGSAGDLGLLPPPAVKLLDAGTNPRATLRYQFTAGQAETLVMELAGSMNLAVGDMAPPEMRTPAVRLGIELRARGVDASGQVSLEGTIERVEVAPAPDVPSAVVAAVGSDLEGLAGTTLTAVVTPRGHVARLAMSVPRETNPQLHTTMDWVRNGLRLLLPVLPDEPIGKGARWEARSPALVGPIRATETLLYTLNSATVEPRLRLAVKVTLAAGEQTAAVSGLPPGAKITIRSLAGEGAGSADLALTSLVPTAEIHWTTAGTGTAQPTGEPLAPVRIKTSNTIAYRRAR